MNGSRVKFSIILLISLIFVIENSFFVETHRSKRFLIFPHHSPTRHQFIGGIGIPADLGYESLIIGYVLKAEFWLPWNSTVYRENPFLPEYSNLLPVNARHWKRHIDHHQRSNDGLRWSLYEAIIERLNSYGYRGSECLLRAICEANHIEFHKDADIFSQLMHVFFSPSTSEDNPLEEHQNNIIIDYQLAEKYGREQQQQQRQDEVHCGRLYNCSLSILDLISKVISL